MHCDDTKSPFLHSMVILQLFRKIRNISKKTHKWLYLSRKLILIHAVRRSKYGYLCWGKKYIQNDMFFGVAVCAGFWPTSWYWFRMIEGDLPLVKSMSMFIWRAPAAIFACTFVKTLFTSAATANQTLMALICHWKVIYFNPLLHRYSF